VATGLLWLQPWPGALPRAAAQSQDEACSRVDRGELVATFADEFDRFRSAPDGRDPASGRPVWRTTYTWGKGPLRTLPSNKEAQHYTDVSEGLDPFRLQGGVLAISARPRVRGVARTMPAELSYTSGLITTQETFSQLYGYFEFRARMPKGQGFWPALWLLPTDLTWPPEIDVVEMHGQAPDVIFTNLHTRTGRGYLRHHRIRRDTSADFHTYAVSWRADEIRWFFDDCEIARAPTPPDLRKPMYLLACLAVGGPGSWPGPADGQSSSVLELDFVRAYQFRDLAGPGAGRGR